MAERLPDLLESYGAIMGARNSPGGWLRVAHNDDGTLKDPLTLSGTKILTGSGTPEGSVIAPVGSLYLRTNGGVGTTLYVKETGSGNTGWSAFASTTNTLKGLTGVYNAVVDFGFNGNGSDNSSAVTTMLNTIDNGDTSAAVWFGAGDFKLPAGFNLAQSGVDFLRLIGVSPPIFNQAPNAARQTVFRFTKATQGTMFDCDPGSGTLQSGIYYEHINFVNDLSGGAHADNIALSIDRTNNSHILRCGFQGWGKSIYSEANNDSAHTVIDHCMINIPAGKYGVWGEGGSATSNVGTGLTIDGGSFSGDTSAVGVYGGPWMGEMSTCGDLKIDGCTGGGIIYKGSDGMFTETRLERCGDASHYAIDILHDAARTNSGHGNCVDHVNITGSGVELPGRFGAGTSACALGLAVFISNTVGDIWTDSGSFNIVPPIQLGNAPSAFTQLAGGMTVAQVITALQTRGF